MVKHNEITAAELHAEIKKGVIALAGNMKLKIFGELNCRSGKRMKRENRVFFHSAIEAMELGFRPCGHCSQYIYIKWKNGFVQTPNDARETQKIH